MRNELRRTLPFESMDLLERIDISGYNVGDLSKFARNKSITVLNTRVLIHHVIIDVVALLSQPTF